MYKQAVILSLTLFTPSVGNASPAGRGLNTHDGRTGTTWGVVLAQRMAAALSRQSHIQVEGRLVGPGRQTVQYLVRYQAKAREYLQETGSMWNQVQVGNQRLRGLRAVSVGKRLYSSTDGKHWMRGSRLVPPSALDTISINPVMAPCCVPGKTAAAQVTNSGLRSSPFGRVYALDYTTTSASASIKGTLLIDARSFLPRRYTEYSRTPAISGTFVLTYGGAFSISAPQS
jgi:hypothetical protein